MLQLHDVDLKLLRVFVTIARCGGFAAAQAALNVSQSTISEQMGSLEVRLGVTLCERGRRGFRLTEQGQAIHQAALRLLLAVDDFCQDAALLKQRIAGQLRLGVIDNTITDPEAPLPRATRRFVARGHEVALSVYVGTPAELEERVLDGRLHLAIGHFPLRVAGLLHQPLYQEAHGLYCGRSHPLHGLPDGSAGLLQRIADSKVVARAYLQRQDLQLLGCRQAAATVDNVEAQAMLILSGAYIGFLPVHYAARWLAQGQLHQLAAGHLQLRSLFTVITRRSSARAPVLQVFLEDLLSGTQP